MRKEKEEASRHAEFTRAKQLIEEQKEKEDAKKKEIERPRREIETIQSEEAKKLAQDLMKRALYLANAGDALAVVSIQGSAGLFSRKHGHFDRCETSFELARKVARSTIINTPYTYNILFYPTTCLHQQRARASLLLRRGVK